MLRTLFKTQIDTDLKLKCKKYASDGRACAIAMALTMKYKKLPFKYKPNLKNSPNIKVASGYGEAIAYFSSNTKKPKLRTFKEPKEIITTGS